MNPARSPILAELKNTLHGEKQKSMQYTRDIITKEVIVIVIVTSFLEAYKNTYGYCSYRGEHVFSVKCTTTLSTFHAMVWWKIC